MYMPRGENECSIQGYDGKGAHGAQYGEDLWDRQGAHQGSERRVLRSSEKWRDDTVRFSRGNAEVLVRARMPKIMRGKGQNS